MKLVKTASGKKAIKISKSEWEDLGEKNGWMKEANDSFPDGPYETFSHAEQEDIEELLKGYKDLYDACEGMMTSANGKLPRWFVENVQNSYRIIGNFNSKYSSRGFGSWSPEDGPYIPDQHKWD